MSDVWFNRQGKPITIEEWATLSRNLEYKRVAETTIGSLWVSTVWLGIDHGFAMPGTKHLPVIFETMIFPAEETYWQHGRAAENVVNDLHVELRELVESQWRYCTEAQAIAGHDQVCVDVRVLMSQIEMAEQVLQEAIDRVKETP